MTNEDRIRALEKIAGYNGWAGSNRISNDEAQDIVLGKKPSALKLRSEEKRLNRNAGLQAASGVGGMLGGAAGVGYAAHGIRSLARPPAGVGRMRIGGRSAIAGLIGSGLLYGGKKLWDLHHENKAKATATGNHAKAVENWANGYFDQVKGKLR